MKNKNKDDLKYVKELKDTIKLLEERVSYIEDYLNRRSRGYFNINKKE